jgi:hypothetical protein
VRLCENSKRYRRISARNSRGRDKILVRYMAARPLVSDPASLFNMRAGTLDVSFNTLRSREEAKEVGCCDFVGKYSAKCTACKERQALY